MFSDSKVMDEFFILVPRGNIHNLVCYMERQNQTTSLFYLNKNNIKYNKHSKKKYFLAKILNSRF